MSVMLISGREDSRRVEWDAADEESVAKAKAIFDKEVETSLAYVDTPTKKEQIREFDPLAESIVVTRPLVGG